MGIILRQSIPQNPILGLTDLLPIRDVMAGFIKVFVLLLVLRIR